MEGVDVERQEGLVRNVLDKVLDPRNQPVLVHGYQGVNRTGVVVGCLERVLGRDVEEVLERYRAHAGGGARDADVRFIRGFDVEPSRERAREWAWEYREFYGVVPEGLMGYCEPPPWAIYGKGKI